MNINDNDNEREECKYVDEEVIKSTCPKEYNNLLKAFEETNADNDIEDDEEKWDMNHLAQDLSDDGIGFDVNDEVVFDPYYENEYIAEKYIKLCDAFYKKTKHKIELHLADSVYFNVFINNNSGEETPKTDKGQYNRYYWIIEK